MENTKTPTPLLKLDLSEQIKDVGETERDRINWLAYNGKMSTNAATSWIRGNVGMVRLDKLSHVVNALGCELDDILIMQLPDGETDE